MPYKDPEKRREVKRRYQERHWEELLKRRQDYYERHREAEQERSRRWRADNPWIKRATNLRHSGCLVTGNYLMGVFYFSQQARCANYACLKPLTAKTAKVDHDHKTNIFRGVLCHRCNTALGRHDAIASLIRPRKLIRNKAIRAGLIEYLERASR